MIVHKHKRVDSAPFNYGRQNAQHIAAASIHSYYEYIKNSEELQWGDGFFLFRGPCFNTGSPPLARGIRGGAVVTMDGRGITPACAGNTLWGLFHLGYLTGITPACAGNTGSVSRPMRHKGDHPRLRGEYILVFFKGINPRGSPPLARGIPSALSAAAVLPGIPPACAGNTNSSAH